MNSETNIDRPQASMSLDLDNLWSYLKTHGDEEWKSFPSYLPVVVPRILEFLEQRNLKITFFVVGQDARQPQHREVLRRIADAGHEIGNHSFHHEPWLHLYSRRQLVSELEVTEQAILAATGQRTVGFRGPGFSYSHDLIVELAARAYLYDASTFPTFLGPVARAYYFLKSRLSKQQKTERKILFGKFSAGLRPNKPFLWNVDQSQLLEIPVTTMPLLKLPMHASYLVYLASYSKLVADLYFRTAVSMCRVCHIRPSMLLHPTDFLDVTDAPQMSFFPAMKLSARVKVAILHRCLDRLEQFWDLVPIRVYANECRKQELASHNLVPTNMATE